MKHEWISNGTQLHGYGVIRCTKCGMELTPYHQRDLLDGECKPRECKPSEINHTEFKKWIHKLKMDAILLPSSVQGELEEHLKFLEWVEQLVEKGLKIET